MAKKSVFSDQNVVKHFSGLICLKLNDGKIANFHQNHRLTLWEKSLFLDFFQLPVLQKGAFSFQNIVTLYRENIGDYKNQVDLIQTQKLDFGQNFEFFSWFVFGLKKAEELCDDYHDK